MPRIELVGGPHDGAAFDVPGSPDAVHMPDHAVQPTPCRPASEEENTIRYVRTTRARQDAAHHLIRFYQLERTVPE